MNEDVFCLMGGINAGFVNATLELVFRDLQKEVTQGRLFVADTPFCNLSTIFRKQDQVGSTLTAVNIAKVADNPKFGSWLRSERA